MMTRGDFSRRCTASQQSSSLGFIRAEKNSNLEGTRIFEMTSFLLAKVARTTYHLVLTCLAPAALTTLLCIYKLLASAWAMGT